MYYSTCRAYTRPGGPREPVFYGSLPYPTDLTCNRREISKQLALKLTKTQNNWNWNDLKIGTVWEVERNLTNTWHFRADAERTLLRFVMCLPDMICVFKNMTGLASCLLCFFLWHLVIVHKRTPATEQKKQTKKTGRSSLASCQQWPPERRKSLPLGRR